MAEEFLIREGFPFRDTFEDFLENYSKCATYWYIPKARSLSTETVSDIRKSLKVIFEEYLESTWNSETQESLLTRLITEGILEPRKEEGTLQDRTALIRINKKMWEVLGLLWVEENSEIVMTDAGFEVMAAENETEARDVIEGQIAKWQYPNPSVGRPVDFRGLLPQLFLLQVLTRLDYKISRDEFELFVNLAQSQDDLDEICGYITQWRDLGEGEKTELLDIVKRIPIEWHQQLALIGDGEMSRVEMTRYRRINLNSAYQRSFYAFSRYLVQEEGSITCTSPEEVNSIIAERTLNLKIPSFENAKDWFAYYGDTRQQPSWFTYLSLEIERAGSSEEASRIVEGGASQLTEEQAEDIREKALEKSIEDFYVSQLRTIEEGLTLYQESDKDGRQYSTPIGRIDLLCKSREGSYVVVEIKAREAEDSVFGQILRYIGWVHRNFEGGRDNVRGIILAGEFPDTARYSRIGLMKEDYKSFLGFKQHGLKLETL